MGGVNLSGPMFDGRATAALKAYCDDVEHEIANRVEQNLQARFAQTFKHRTGRYEASVGETSSSGGISVNDGNSVYGPWLEGTGSRNAPKTRFKGYTNWRSARQWIGRQAKFIAEHRLKNYMNRL